MPSESPIPPPRATSAAGSSGVMSWISWMPSTAPASASGPSNLSTSLTRLSSTPTAPSSAPTPSAKRASTSPTTAPGAIIPCWSRWPTPRSRCTWSIAAATAPHTELAASFIDRAVLLCRQAGFRSFLVRGDTDFTQTKHLDRWDDAGDLRFLFGIDARPNLVALAEQLPDSAYSFLERPVPPIKTVPRQRPPRHKARIVQERGLETIHTLEEMVAEFDYRPVACDRDYRLIVLRKKLAIEKRGVRIREEYRYFFFITNDREMPADQAVLTAGGRCDQENLVAQLKGGVHALTTPVDNLVSNWAYMVMASLAWSLKAWAALLVPETSRHAREHRIQKRTLLRMEFKTFRAAMIEIPCQIVRSGRRLVYRLLSWNPWQGVFLRLVERLNGCWLY